MSKKEAFIPYSNAYNRYGNMVYRFEWNGSYIWDVVITIDELHGDIITYKECSCPSWTKFNQGEDCKHIKAALKILEEFGVEMKQDELQE